MLGEYISKLRIGMPIVSIHNEQIENGDATRIKGQIGIHAGLLKAKVKRYDIEIVGKDDEDCQEILITERSVFCSVTCERKEEQFFSYDISMRDGYSFSHYIVRIRVDFERAPSVIKEKTVVIR